MSKKCLKCDLILDLSHYHKDITKPDGLHSYCKLCRKALRNNHYKNNKDKVTEYNKKWAQDNKEKVALKQRNWRIKNPDKYKKIYQNFQNKHKFDPKYRLIASLRERLRQILKTKKIAKNNSFIKHLGCNLEDLIKHFESRFEVGMTWNNYGLGPNKWSIDHIYPLSLAKTEEELYKLQHYTNLKPMWSIDNLKKGNRI